ncbi:hypothetical protein PENSPDRAFT_682474 [Peniophora sp. CONT]|nr:hypothetical protein PENSPDRAFT_682474 [Peniophora sp. CONT]
MSQPVIYTSTQTSQPVAPGQPLEVSEDAYGRNSRPGMVFRDTEENLLQLQLAAESARKAGNTADDPIRLLALVRSAITRIEVTQFNADLRFALEEMKKVTTLSGSRQLRALSADDRHKFLWGTFELCSTYLARDRVLEGHTMIALDAATNLNDLIGHFEASRLVYRSRSRELTRCMDSIWHNLWNSRVILATMDPMRWYLNSLLHNWVHAAMAFNCLPAWGTSDIYWLSMFLWIKQPNSAIENPKQLIDCMQLLDRVGKTASSTLEGRDRLFRITTIVGQAVKLFGEDALYSRFKDSLGNTSFSPKDLEFIMGHAHRYCVHPPLSYKLIESGTAHAFFEAPRWQQRRGAWDSNQARICCDFILQVILLARGRAEHQITSLLITEEHMLRDFLLPAMWLDLQTRLDVSKGATSAYADDVLPEVELVNYAAEAARRLGSSGQGTGGHAMMNTLRTEVSPYWHLMDEVIQGISTPTASSTQQKTILAQSWRRLGKALQLDVQRAPRQLEGPEPIAETFCSWPLCLYHTQKPPMSLKSCTGCGEVRYCSKKCQKSDWKLNDHKARCRRVKK